MITYAVTATLADGGSLPLVLDQRDIIAAADAGAPPPEPGADRLDVVGFMRFLRVAAAAHLARDGWAGDFARDVLDVSMGDDETPGEPDPTPTPT